MCGIAGLMFREGNILPEQLIQMRDSLSHRGPDDAGIWINNNHTVGMAHRRLAIIDLSPAGHQPMADQMERLRIVFNGEIYNFMELRRELESHGWPFRTKTDTEVILYAYHQWGEECVARFNGMFAFAIWDSSAQKLFMARDRIGKKPLYYYHNEHMFVFASECKAILSFLHHYTLDSDALNCYFSFGYIPGEMCIFSGMHKMLPGHCLTYEPETDCMRTYPYWTLPLETHLRHKSVLDEESLLDELQILLEDSVRLRMISDVPLGVFLSGGVDSSLVTAVASKVSSSPVKTFTIGFPGGKNYDETPYASLVAKHFGTDHHLLPVPAAVDIDMLHTVAGHLDEPLADPSILPTYQVSQLTRRHVTVALGGDGGDELFGGYMWYRNGLQAERIMKNVPRWFRTPVASLASFLPPGVKGRNYLISHANDLCHYMVNARSIFDLAARRLLFKDDVIETIGIENMDRPEKYKQSLWLKGEDSVLKMSVLDLKTFLPDDILFKVDRASMAFALEVRAPWLDYRIIEFAINKVLSFHKVCLTGTRWLQRKLADRLLPASLDLNRKQGFVMPVHEWMRGSWGDMTLEVLNKSQAREWINADFVEALLRGQRRGYSNGVRLFACLMFALWLERLKTHS
jgi:asparagine synthase (glutamine-hydrolysing)